MSQVNSIERCCICLKDDATKHSIVEQCLPVKAFGDHETALVKVAVVGLNPASTEFQFQGQWKEKHLRLPILYDYGITNRELLDDAAISDATHRRKNYFRDPKRKPHSYFEVLDCFLGRVNPYWSFAVGNVVHTDIVACVTIDKFGELTRTDRLRSNCFPHFIKTVSDLPPKTLLLLNGATVYKSLRSFTTNLEKEELVNVIGLRGWTGTVIIAEREHRFCGWSFPVGKLSKIHQIDLAHWVNQQLLHEG